MIIASVADPSVRLPLSHMAPIVFVVDDDYSVRESLIHYAGYQAETFSSAHEFLDRPPAQRSSCLLLDVNLPDLNGLELQERIAERVNMPIIFTRHGDVAMTVKAMKAGAIEFLTRQLGRDVLNAIKGTLARRQTTLDHEAEMQALRDRYASLSGRERMLYGHNGAILN
jgi:FixJ family two-component response regulator